MPFSHAHIDKPRLTAPKAWTYSILNPESEISFKSPFIIYERHLRSIVRPEAKFFSAVNLWNQMTFLLPQYSGGIDIPIPQGRNQSEWKKGVVRHKQIWKLAEPIALEFQAPE